ncbi:class III lanthionine synthetase LanKC [Pseudonocardia cypriaca]|uniref:Protein kinase-like protein n=1 Tax=Pseudonocardia cypriaca TaxID=882449 RepID=A0A543FSA3_9PSEU|nr:class III lanthionine synthetase LanKC [Pseudonocardia cypriaca]TQM36713.1 protein kinase-like protein [Pseudonocardia cypriaca]
MDMRYQAFCMAHRLFYEPVRNGVSEENGLLVGRTIPDGWHVSESSEWTMLIPVDARLRNQGWKLHVSACPDNAPAILDVVWDHCVSRRIPFKFVPSQAELVARNSKYADRGGSGKFVTVYPSDDEQLEQLVTDLRPALAGHEGPYILSDLRIGAGPLFVRYGGFARRFLRSADGEPVPAIEAPDGELVEDRRDPTFAPPAWARIPDFLAPDLAARNDDSIDFPFTVEQPLHFSNGGGIYKVIDRNGRTVVLREGRPHAGLDAVGRDAVTRVRREAEILELLAGLPCVPQLYDSFTCWEHEFLVQEFIEGRTFSKETVGRYPLIHPETSDEEIAEYTAWALATLQNIRDALDLLHERGVVFGDLHPHNVIVRPDGEVCFVDFEIASVDQDERVGLGAPGYMAPPEVTGFARDEYAMGCLRIAAFFPLNSILPLDDTKVGDVVRAIGTRFPVPPEFLDVMLRELTLPGRAGVRTTQRGATGPLLEDLDAGRDVIDPLSRSVADGILASATPDRLDRLFPGDIHVFLEDSLGLAWGAAGVLHALHVCGFDVPEAHVDWLSRAVDRVAADHPVGLFNGLHGVAYVLDELGRRERALAVLERVMAHPLDLVPTGLQGGMAGIGINMLHFADATGDSRFAALADDVTDRLADFARRPVPGGTTRLNGLVRGAAGRAMFFQRRYERDGNSDLLDLSRIQLERDLDACVDVPDGTLQLDEGFRVLPYLGTGSAGIALVLADHLRYERVPRFEEAIDPIRRAAEPEFVILPGLFNGRSGLIALLAHLRESGQRPAEVMDPIVRRLVSRLAWHALDVDGHVAFPGDGLLRISMDLSTGSAGVLLALRAARGGRLAVPGFAPMVPAAPAAVVAAV